MPSYQLPDSIEGTELVRTENRFRSALSITSSSTAAAGSSTPDVVPYVVYAELCRECDNLHGYNDHLRTHVDSMAGDTHTPLEPTTAARLRALIEMANGRVEQMPPPTSTRYGEGRMLVQMMIDELQRIVDMI